MQPSPLNNPRQRPDLFGHRKYWAHRLTPAPFLPMSREEMDLLGWDQCDVILVTGDAYVDHPSFGMAIVGRVLEAQGFRVGHHRAARLALDGGLRAARRAGALLRHHGRQHGLDGQPLHGRQARAQRRRVHARRRRRPAAGSQRHRLRAARARGVRRCPDRHRRHRSEPAAHRALRLLAGESAPLDPARRARRSARVRQRRAADRRDRAPLGGRRAAERAARHSRHRVARQRGRRRLDGDRLDASRRAGPRRPPSGSVCDGARDRGGREARRRARRARRALHAPRADGGSRAQLHPAAELRASARRSRALRARVADPAHGVEPRQRARARAAARRQRRLAESAAAAASLRGDGPHLRAAVRARAAPVVRPSEDPGLRDDPLLRHDPARLLRRLHVLLDHGARRPNHPEPQRGLDPARDRDDPRLRAGLHGRHLRSRRADGQHVSAWRARAARSSRRAGGRRACIRPCART